MSAQAYQQGRAVGQVGKTDTQSGEMKRCAEKIWNAISKYVTFDDDAIFKDPNWPYMWDKKK